MVLGQFVLYSFRSLRPAGHVRLFNILCHQHLSLNTATLRDGQISTVSEHLSDIVLCCTRNWIYDYGFFQSEGNND